MRSATFIATPYISLKTDQIAPKARHYTGPPTTPIAATGRVITHPCGHEQTICQNGRGSEE